MTQSGLQPYADAQLDLPQLVAAASALLAGHVPSDARVAPLPDARTVRYYQSLGIVDPPRRDGRSAIYEFRHLVQVVATKLLQGRGYSLAKVQVALAGRTTAQLAEAAGRALGGLPSTSAAPPPTLREAPPPTPPGHRALIAVELAPGVNVTLDPSRVRDPDTLLRRLAAALALGGSS